MSIVLKSNDISKGTDRLKKGCGHQVQTNGAVARHRYGAGTVRVRVLVRVRTQYRTYYTRDCTAVPEPCPHLFGACWDGLG